MSGSVIHGNLAKAPRSKGRRGKRGAHGGVFFRRKRRLLCPPDRNLAGKAVFHWITGRALRELVDERKIGFDAGQSGTIQAHFYRPLRHRYPRRQIKDILKLIAEFSNPDFTRAVGHNGETLFAAGLSYTGFRILGQKVQEVDGKLWTESKHDLDFLITRDGVRYGVEVKNQLGYFDQTEFQIKLKMCQHFGVRPMFVCRAAPQTYIHLVRLAGGYTLITENQDLAKRVRGRLKLPVNVIRQLPDTALNRFRTWHERHVPSPGTDM